MRRTSKGMAELDRSSDQQVLTAKTPTPQILKTTRLTERERRITVFDAWCLQRGHNASVATVDTLSSFMCWWCMKKDGSTKTLHRVLSNLRVSFLLEADSRCWLSKEDEVKLRGYVQRMKEMLNHKGPRIFALRMEMLSRTVRHLDRVYDQQLLKASKRINLSLKMLLFIIS